MATISTTSRTPSTPKPPPLKKSSSGSQSSKSQKSITGFFQKKSAETSQESPRLPAPAKKLSRGSSLSLTPAPSSDAPEYPEEMEGLVIGNDAEEKSTGLPSPITPLDGGKTAASRNPIKLPLGFSSPSRNVSKILIPRTARVDRSRFRQRKP